MSSPPSVFVPCSDSVVGVSELRSSSLLLLLPSVSVGNVGQLCIDALISSYNAVKVGYIRTPHILPLVAADATASFPAQVIGRLSLPVELFYAQERGLLLLQQRAPAVTGLNGAYAGMLRRLMEELKVEEVLLLTSASAHLRSDVQIQHDEDTLTDTEGQEGAMRSQEEGEVEGQGLTSPHAVPVIPKSPIHFLTTPLHSTAIAAASSLQWSPLTEGRPPPPPPLPIADSDDFPSPPSILPPPRVLTPLYPFSLSIKGGGVGRYLWPLLCDSSTPSRHIRATALLLYAVEGDNSREALVMAREVDAFLRLLKGEEAVKGKEREWRTPLSWQFVFGREPQREIYL